MARRLPRSPRLPNRAQLAATPPARSVAAPRAQVAQLGNGHRTPSHSRLPAHAGAVHAACRSPRPLAPRCTLCTQTPAEPASDQPSASGGGSPPAAQWQICRLAGGTSSELLTDIDRALAEPAAAWRAAAARGFVPADKHRLAIVADSPETLADRLRLARPQLDNLAARTCWNNKAFSTGCCRVCGRRWRSSFRAKVRNIPACCGRWSKAYRPRAKHSPRSTQ